MSRSPAQKLRMLSGSATGSVQLVFIDKTTLNIGPNSTLVIEKFVFDPATAAPPVPFGGQAPAPSSIPQAARLRRMRSGIGATALMGSRFG